MSHDSLKMFDALPAQERWFCRARLELAPLEQVAALVHGADVVDVGCGHGVLAALLLHERPDRRVVGIDPDARKIGWATRSVGKNDNAEFRACGIDALATERPASFDCVVVADVLYLLSRDQWPAFLAHARQLLKPGGRLVIKDAENDGSWRARKALWQERLMVHVLRRTVSTGDVGFATRDELQAHVARAGFVVDEVTSCARGYSTPHLVLTAHLA